MDTGAKVVLQSSQSLVSPSTLFISPGILAITKSRPGVLPSLGVKAPQCSTTDLSHSQALNMALCIGFLFVTVTKMPGPTSLGAVFWARGFRRFIHDDGKLWGGGTAHTVGAKNRESVLRDAHLSPAIPYRLGWSQFRWLFPGACSSSLETSSDTQAICLSFLGVSKCKPVDNGDEPL